MLKDDLARLLAEQSSAGAEHLHIIRFRDPELYASTLMRIDKLRRSGRRLRHIRAMPSIRGISCPLRSAGLLRPFKDRLRWEHDRRIRVTPHSLLPLPLQNRPLDFDPSRRIPWGVREIRAISAWKISRGRGIHIGVVDTGADYGHPDLRGSLGSGVNLLNRFSPPNDDNGHGTHICGTIAAAGRAGGIAGVAPAATIQPVKAFDQNGTAYISDIIMGIDWCVANRMDIINMSFGMRQRSESLWEAVRNAYRAGVVIVASSGNDGNRAAIDYPARFPYTIAVGATTEDKRVAPFSNRSNQIDIYAPGENIYSTWLRHKYNVLSGTSMATAHVSGVLALAMAMRPSLSASRLKRYIRGAAGGLASGRKARLSGSGLINAVKTLRLVRKLEPRAKKPLKASRKAGGKRRFGN